MRKKEDKRSGSASSCAEKRLIFAGKISEKKGVFSLLRALTLLAEKGERFTLTLAGGAGDLEEYERIRKMAKENGIPLAQCMLVEDTLSTLLQAHDAGICAVHVSNIFAGNVSG